MKKRIFRRWANDPLDLRALLVARLGVTGEEAADLIAAGSVYVGQDRAVASSSVAAGAQITVHTVRAHPAPRLHVVHSDDDVAIIDKPAGLPSQAEPGQRAFSVEAAIERELGREARLMHRLDKDASGLMLVALRASAYPPLQHALTTGAIDRRYIAIGGGEFHGDGAIRLRIGRHPRDRRLRAALPEHAPAGEPACTRYRVVGHGSLASQPVTAFSLELETGRTHQIRVHLSAIAHPIVGDEPYGGAPFERLCLHASALELPHPVTGRPLRARAPLPEPFARLVPGLTSLFA
jgi:23S rRNA pseudouridine1911/1915/1917 synthase